MSDDPALVIVDKVGKLLSAEVIRLNEQLPPLQADLLVDGSLARAAACYAATAAVQVSSDRSGQPLPPCYIHKDWPWPRQDWQPGMHAHENLVKATALLIHELQRQERRLMRGATAC